MLLKNQALPWSNQRMDFQKYISGEGIEFEYDRMFLRQARRVKIKLKYILLPPLPDLPFSLTTNS